MDVRNPTVGISPRIVDLNLVLGPGSGISEVGVEAPITSPGEAGMDLEAASRVPMIGTGTEDTLIRGEGITTGAVKEAEVGVLGTIGDTEAEVRLTIVIGDGIGPRKGGTRNLGKV